MTRDLVSIIIPCYNNQDYIAEAITSALAQSYAHVEVIVVNDGSTDNSAAEISRFEDRITHLSQANAGACVARNTGLAQARGTFIKFLDGDDILEPDCVERQVVHAQRSDAVIFGDFVLINQDGRKEHHPSHYEKTGLLDGEKADLSTFFDHSVFISTTLYRRSQLQKVGGFNPLVIRGQEHELHLRLFINGVDFEYRPGICFQYRQHVSPTRISVTSRNDSYFRIYENFRLLLADVRDGERSADWESNKSILGSSAWRTGRRHLRAGDGEAAENFFRIARELGGDDIAHGSASYRLLMRYVGPIWAERVSTLRHRLRTPFKPTD